MKYQFPIITNIEDVLEAIKGRPEFVVSNKGDYTVVNYVVANEHTFHMDGPNDILGAIRRECRGLIFDNRGDLISRSYHKFFNLNEREETQLHLIKPLLQERHQKMMKMDGSMIRLVKTGGQYRLGTKMGVTDTSVQAEQYLTADQLDYLVEDYENGVTTILEYTAPENRIVVRYEKPELVLTARRLNTTGVYLNKVRADGVFGHNPIHNYDGDLEDFIAENRGNENEEGIVVRFTEGHMIKIKWDQYVMLHKTKDRIQFDRNIIAIVLAEAMDDLIPFLDEPDLIRVKAVEQQFWSAITKTHRRIQSMVELVKEKYAGDNKQFALNEAKQIGKDASYVFRALRHVDFNLRDALLENAKQRLGTNTSYDELMKWMDGNV